MQQSAAAETTALLFNGINPDVRRNVSDHPVLSKNKQKKKQPGPMMSQSQSLVPGHKCGEVSLRLDHQQIFTQDQFMCFFLLINVHNMRPSVSKPKVS